MFFLLKICGKEEGQVERKKACANYPFPLLEGILFFCLNTKFEIKKKEKKEETSLQISK